MEGCGSACGGKLSGEECQQLGLVPSHIHVWLMLRWCRWWWSSSSTWEVAVFSSAAVSCVCLEPRSSGACRSNDTTTATGILAPRVEIRHFFCLSNVFSSPFYRSADSRLFDFFLNFFFYIAEASSQSKAGRVERGFTQSNPGDASSPSSLTQHQIDARRESEGENKEQQERKKKAKTKQTKKPHRVYGFSSPLLQIITFSV